MCHVSHKPIPIFHMKHALLAHVFLIECQTSGHSPAYKASNKAGDEEHDDEEHDDAEEKCPETLE